MIRPSSSLVATAGALIVVFAPLSALAQTEDARHAAIRRTMIENAQRAQTAGQFAQCAELAQRAVSLQDTGSPRRLLAECQLSAGMVVDAIGNGELCLSMLRRDERAVGRDVHMAACERVVREGRARTTQLVVRTPAPEPPNLRVTVSGHVLDRVEWNIATIAAAGPLVVEATADGMAPFRRNVDAASGALTEIRVEFAPLASASHGASNGTQSSASHGVDNRTHVRPSDNSGGSSAANSGASLVERPRDSRPIERPAARVGVTVGRRGRGHVGRRRRWSRRGVCGARGARGRVRRTLRSQRAEPAVRELSVRSARGTADARRAERSGLGVDRRRWSGRSDVGRRARERRYSG